MMKTLSRKQGSLRILVALGFFALSQGIWYNFQSLWLQQNGLSISSISTVTSLSSLACVSIMILFFDFITKNRLKKFVTGLLFVKVISLFLLCLLNGTGLFLPMKLLIMLDIVVDTEIVISIYPLLSLFQRDDKLYCKKDLVNSTFHDIGVLLGGFLLGKVLFQFEITFNICLFLAVVFALLALFIISNLKIPPMKEEEKKPIFFPLMKFLKQDKLSKVYLSYIFVGNFSYYMVTGLKMLLLTSALLVPVKDASTYILIISIVSDMVGFLVLKKFTFRNNAINILIKFGGRVFFYVLAFLMPSTPLFLIALSYALLFANSYSHITDAPFINRFDHENQLAFCNLRNMVNYTSQALGIAVCGIMFTLGIRYLFLVAAIFAACQTGLAIYASVLRKRMSKEKEIS